MDLVKAWEELQAPGDRHAFAAAWLAIQCSLIPGCRQGVLVLGDGKGAFVPVASWPEHGPGERLTGILNRTLAEREGLLLPLPDSAGPDGEGGLYALAYPLVVDEGLRGAVAVEVGASAETQLRQAMEALQWGAAWLENQVRREQGREDRAALTRLTAAVDLLALVLAEEGFPRAATAFVTELATRLDCDRVSLGLAKGSAIRVVAISHTAIVGEKMNLVRSIGAVMEEALMQRTAILYPPRPDGPPAVLRDHERMVQTQGPRAMLTLPLYAGERYYAALTLERQDNRPFTDEEHSYLVSVAALTGPALEGKYQNDRPVLFVVAAALRKQAERLFGAGYAGRKIVLAALVLLAVFFSQAKSDYRLAADAILEGAITRSIVAPADGYLRDSAVKAGSRIGKDAVMCRLEERDLLLERQNWLSKKNQYERQRQEAVAKHSLAEASIVSAQLDQAEAQLALTENKLSQTAIRAPFAGIVIRGDLSQRLGGAVAKGEELFQIAPLDAYRLILKVDEHDIDDVAEGQKGALVLSSLSGSSFGFTVRKITPITTAAEGRNYFRVEADLAQASPRLRPGMEGVGKIAVDRRLLIAIWTRQLVDWLRLRLWGWIP